LTTLGGAETAVLQGVRQLKDLAKASLITPVVSLLSSIPLYYFFGIGGIVPAMILSALSTYIVTRFYSRKLHISTKDIHLTLRQVFSEGKSMISLGAILMIAILLGLLSRYLINIFIRYTGSLDDVGLFQAASSITNQYIGLILTAMAVDYFPRLAAVASDNVAVRKNVNIQSDISLLIATPCIILLIIAAPIAIQVLLSSEFAPIIPLLRCIAFGLFIKVASFALGYISFSKGDQKVYFWMEGVFGNSKTLLLNIVGYYFWGLAGLGYSFVISYAIYYVVVLYVAYKRYDFQYDRSSFALLGILFAVCGLSYLITLLPFDPIIAYSLQAILLGAVSYYAIRQLNKRMDLKPIIERFLKRSTRK
jgi:O-antigen/teichoic acid export membrane protein